jgi:hypothetical protein
MIILMNKIIIFLNFEMTMLIRTNDNNELGKKCIDY